MYNMENMSFNEYVKDILNGLDELVPLFTELKNAFDYSNRDDDKLNYFNICLNASDDFIKMKIKEMADEIDPVLAAEFPRDRQYAYDKLVNKYGKEKADFYLEKGREVIQSQSTDVLEQLFNEEYNLYQISAVCSLGYKNRVDALLKFHEIFVEIIENKIESDKPEDRLIIAHCFIIFVRIIDEYIKLLNNIGSIETFEKKKNLTDQVVFPYIDRFTKQNIVKTSKFKEKLPLPDYVHPAGDGGRRGKMAFFGTIMGIAGFVSIPATYLAIAVIVCALSGIDIAEVYENWLGMFGLTGNFESAYGLLYALGGMIGGIIGGINIGKASAESAAKKKYKKANREIVQERERLKAINDQIEKDNNALINEFLTKLKEGVDTEFIYFLFERKDQIQEKLYDLRSKCVRLYDYPEMSFIPYNYRTDEEAIQTMIDYFNDKRADNIKEAINLYISEKETNEYRQRMEYMQKQTLEEEQRKTYYEQQQAESQLRMETERSEYYQRMEQRQEEYYQRMKEEQEEALSNMKKAEAARAEEIEKLRTDVLRSEQELRNTREELWRANNETEKIRKEIEGK